MAIDLVTETPVKQASVQRLRPGATGTLGVVFMALAAAAPLTAMTGNTPVAIGFGNGTGAPGGFLIATVFLSLFAIGYATMAKHVTSTGAFAAYISRGLGRVVGMASGTAVTMAYMVFAAALVGIFSYFSQNALEAFFNIHVSWMVPALVMIILDLLFSYFDIGVAAKFLGAMMVLEVACLGLGAFAVLLHGGGANGLMPQALSPVNALTPAHGVTGASAGLGLFFAFWSWVGFESTAMYGEESKDPQHVIPRATMIAVIGVGVFYVFVSWMAIAYAGPAAIGIAQDSNTSLDLILTPARVYFGGWMVDVFRILMVTSSFACGLAFHNCAARYMYALGRESASPKIRSSLGATHPVHRSPYVAAILQGAVSLIIVLAFYLTGGDPYLDMYTILAILGTAAILIVQTLCAFAVISYFMVRHQHPESAHWFRTFVAPLFGGIGMAYVVVLLFENMGTAAGSAVSSPLYHLIPWIVVASFLFGGVGAIWAKYTKAPEVYARLGHICLESDELTTAESKG